MNSNKILRLLFKGAFIIPFHEICQRLRRRIISSFCLAKSGKKFSIVSCYFTLHWKYIYGLQTLAKLDTVHSASEKYQLSRSGLQDHSSSSKKAARDDTSVRKRCTSRSWKSPGCTLQQDSELTSLCGRSVALSESKSAQSSRNNLLFTGWPLLKLAYVTTLSTETGFMCLDTSSCVCKMQWFHLMDVLTLFALAASPSSLLFMAAKPTEQKHTTATEYNAP